MHSTLALSNLEWLALQFGASLEEPSLAFVVGISVTALLVGIGLGIPWHRHRISGDDEVDLSQFVDDDLFDDPEQEARVLDDVADRHQTVVVPAAVEWGTRRARVGDQWTSTVYVADWPDYPSDGYLSELFSLTDVTFDCTVYIQPKQQERAQNELQRVAEDLQVDADIDRSVRSTYLQQRANDATATYTAVENGQQVFSQAMYVTVRAETKDDLQSAVQEVRSRLRESPAELTPKTAICNQDQALQSAAPIGRNPFGRDAIALGGAVGRCWLRLTTRRSSNPKASSSVSIATTTVPS